MCWIWSLLQWRLDYLEPTEHQCYAEHSFRNRGFEIHFRTGLEIIGVSTGVDRTQPRNWATLQTRLQRYLLEVGSTNNRELNLKKSHFHCVSILENIIKILLQET